LLDRIVTLSIVSSVSYNFYLHGGTEENYQKQTGCEVSGSRFEPRLPMIWSRCANHEILTCGV